MGRKAKGLRRRKTAAEGGAGPAERSQHWTNYWHGPDSEANRATRKANVVHYSRTGVPSGMTRPQAAMDRAQAMAWADIWMKELEHADIVLEDGRIVPGSDDAIAKASIREAAVIALSAGNKKDKLTALNLCLNFTKSKPVARTEMAVKKPEDWLMEALEASKKAKELAIPDDGS